VGADMTFKNKKTINMLLLMVAIITGYITWLLLRPVNIIAVHGRGEFSDILVKSFPITDRGKIKWWLENTPVLQDKYKVPNPAKDGFFSVTFWSFGEGYKETDGYDRLCFDDKEPPLNCIEKDALFSVDKSPNLGTVFTVYEGGVYRLDDNGNIVEIKRK